MNQMMALSDNHLLPHHPANRAAADALARIAEADGIGQVGSSALVACANDRALQAIWCARL